MSTTGGWPAGWYPDPDDAARLRYWDGGAWTEQRMDAAPPPPEPEAPGGPARTSPPATHPAGTGGVPAPGMHAGSSRRWLVVVAIAVLVLAGVTLAKVVGGGGGDDRGVLPLTITTAGPFDETTTTEYYDDTTTTEYYDDTTTTEDVVPSADVTATDLTSMIGRSVTDDELAMLSDACYRSFEFGQDVHCEGELGFGLSFDGDTVREVYLYDYYPPDQSSFNGSLPGGVTWDSTLSDITSTIGDPDCVDTIIGYNVHYTSGDGELDYEYTVDASGDPTADLQKITIRQIADRPGSCH